MSRPLAVASAVTSMSLTADTFLVSVGTGDSIIMQVEYQNKRNTIIIIRGEKDANGWVPTEEREKQLSRFPLFVGGDDELPANR